MQLPHCHLSLNRCANGVGDASRPFARCTRKDNGPTCLMITADIQESPEGKLCTYTDSPSTKVHDHEISFDKVAYLQHERKDLGMTSPVEFVEFCFGILSTSLNADIPLTRT